jgi:DNA-directed RNA polymerase subunit RPC12/RpoP
MLDPYDLFAYEFCCPGGLTGETEINCPHCKALLTMPVDDPFGEESYQCATCGLAFTVDWASG